jgi:3-hydroxybutyryl-CoA dehydratase
MGLPERFPIGAADELVRTLGPAEVKAFADLSGDHNPIHLDAAAAARTRFGRPVCHGAHVASLVSALLGTKFPGPGTIFVSQTFRFTKPAFVGDTLVTRAEVVGHERDRFVRLKATVARQGAETVLEGEVVILPPEEAK